MRIPALLAATLAGLVAGSPAAQATAVAGIEQAFWSFTFSGFLPDPDPRAGRHDIAWECGGDSGSIEALSCGDTISGAVSLDQPGHETLSLLQPGSVRITNNAGVAETIAFDLNFSAFNPGGSPVGARVDDPSREHARFDSWVLGPDPTALPTMLDRHGCATTPALPQCGVPNPDDSIILYMLSLAPFETLVLPFELGLLAEVRVIPEPGLALSLAGAIGLLAMWHFGRARRASSA